MSRLLMTTQKLEETAAKNFQQALSIFCFPFFTTRRTLHLVAATSEWMIRAGSCCGGFCGRKEQRIYYTLSANESRKQALNLAAATKQVTAVSSRANCAKVPMSHSKTMQLGVEKSRSHLRQTLKEEVRATHSTNYTPQSD